ncbi:hypothetical protein RF11_15006 [Thelohanellus kitauei]|uniref:Calcineurin-like phosphoesterase domain-containing protein n=1 Tax=Thelohanellus kitauei TaxID=669202 RepID=A0A0C2J3W1_THEKT|nr:hypothetical protein RF11_15006 [Thelohanellus kitauei]
MIILLYLAFLTAQITAVYHHDPKTYDEDELHIVVLGDFGKSENKSKIKANVVKQIKERNKEKPYGKGILLGDNYYPDGLTRGDFSPIHKVFSDSFTATEFPIDFLSVLGNHGYHGDIETFIQYYNHDKRYYQPARYYLYSK